MALDNSTRQQLVDAALEARQMAYAPYSEYFVGAALLTEDGSLFTGCNVENASYGATICAERTAAVKAVSEGQRRFSAIAIATRDGGSPCGICRQVLYEFGPQMTVLMVNEHGQVTHEGPLHALLPLGFGPGNLLSEG
ncbi:MAG: cytidine deaminase [Anaerolineae bacterium]